MMTIDQLIEENPKFHRTRNGEAVSWGLNQKVLRYLDGILESGMVTVETGAGMSTIVFGMNKTEHHCITPAKFQKDSIEQYLFKNDIPGNIYFHLHSSDQILPFSQLMPDLIDIALIDGAHEFPFPIVDYHYLAKKLKIGGKMIIDDIQLAPVRFLVDFMIQSDHWELIEQFDRTAIFVLKKRFPQNWGKWNGKQAKERPALPIIPAKPLDKHTFLFLVCPPHSGSTLLHEFISTSDQVSATKYTTTREGEDIPEAHELIRIENRWKPETEIRWDLVKEIWMKHWDLSKPILLDKSTSNVPHPLSMEKAFGPSHFICMVRDPYAHCESLIRRMGYEEQMAAWFTIHCLKLQKKNLAELERRCLVRYEDFTEYPELIKEKILTFLPALEALEHDGLFHAHNFKEKALKIQNLNEEKINKLSDQQINFLTRYFRKHKYLLDYFGYKLR